MMPRNLTHHKIFYNELLEDQSNFDGQKKMM